MEGWFQKVGIESLDEELLWVAWKASLDKELVWRTFMESLDGEPGWRARM